jgi:hypothetical protein
MPTFEAQLLLVLDDGLYLGKSFSHAAPNGLCAFLQLAVELGSQADESAPNSALEVEPGP